MTEKRIISLDCQRFETVGDGDCLFHSIEKCLGGSRFQHMTPKLMRSLVSRSVLRPRIFDRIVLDTDNVIETWMNMYRSGIQHEVLHVAGAVKLNKKATDLKQADLEDMAEKMMDKSLYWGDEYAIAFLEKLLNVRFLVIHDGDPAKRGTDKVQRYPLFYILLYLRDGHYEPLSCDGQFRFQKEDLPYAARVMFDI